MAKARKSQMLCDLSTIYDSKFEGHLSSSSLYFKALKERGTTCQDSKIPEQYYGGRT